MGTRKWTLVGYCYLQIANDIINFSNLFSVGGSGWLNSLKRLLVDRKWNSAYVNLNIHMLLTSCLSRNCMLLGGLAYIIMLVYVGKIV